MPDDTGAEDLLTEADDAEWIHVPTGSRHIAPTRKVICALNCEILVRLSV